MTFHAMIKTKSVYDPAADDDGLRVLVTRYWPRGVSKERVHLWCKDLSPEPALIKAYKSAQISWEEFRGLYIKGLDSEAGQAALKNAPATIKASLKKPGRDTFTVTLLCTCRDESLCHRSVLRTILGKGLQG